MSVLPSPSTSRFGPSIAWLSAHGVASEGLARLFRVRPATIRSLNFRSRKTRPPKIRLLDLFDIPLSEAWSALTEAQLRSLVGIRNEPDFVVGSRSRTRKIEWLETEIESRFRQGVAENRYIDGVSALRKLLPHVGYAAQAQRIRLAGDLHYRIAWLYAHIGRSLSAIEETLKAMTLAKCAFSESEDLNHLVLLGEAALVGANACQLRHDPSGALRFLAVVRQAMAASGSKTLSIAYHHQLATAYFQIGPAQDEPACNQFERAAQAQDAFGPNVITATRKTSLVRGNWDDTGGSEEVLDQIALNYPKSRSTRWR